MSHPPVRGGAFRLHFDRSGFESEPYAQRLKSALFRTPQEGYQQWAVARGCLFDERLLVRSKKIGDKRVIA